MRFMIFLVAVEISRIGTALGAELYSDQVQTIIGWISIIAMCMDLVDFIKSFK